MLKHALLGLKWLWKNKTTVSFTLANQASDGKSYMAVIETEHRIFNNKFFFPFYWYANSKGMASTHGFLGVYQMKSVLDKATKEAIRLSL